MVDRGDSFLKEVNEEMRRERLLKLWEQYGTFFIAGVIFFFIAFGAYQWRQSQAATAQEQLGAQFEAAVKLASDGKADDALKSFIEISKAGSAGYEQLAQLRIAAAHAKAGRTAESLAIFDAMASRADITEIMRDFAALQAAMLRLDQADWTELKNRLTPLTEEKRAWRVLAREMLGLAAFRAGKIDEATKLFEQNLGDRATSTAASRRAQDMLAILTDAAAASASKPTPAGGTSTGKPDAAKGPADKK